MNALNFILILYGVVIVLIDAYGVWKPRRWIEYVERQFIYSRERITVGVVAVLLGAAPVYWIINTGWGALLLAVSFIFFVVGVLVLAFPDSLRNFILSFGELSDKLLRILFALDGAFGVLLILLGVF